MASTQNEMRFHIRSVGNIAQVTRALEAVSTRKARRTTDRLTASRPYIEHAWKVVLHLVRQPAGRTLHPLFATRPKPKRTLAIVVTSDRGLAGGYNMNVIREVLRKFDGFTRPVSFLAIGSRGAEMLSHRERDIFAEFKGLASPAEEEEIISIGDLALDAFEDHTFDEVFLCYTEFIDRMMQRVEIRKLLPLEPEMGDSASGYNRTHPTHALFSFLPDEKDVFDAVLPRFISLQVYAAVLSGEASEHTVRMAAMHSATKNAKELMDSLEKNYHKARQKDITNEILDIASATEALEESDLNG